MMFDRLLKRTAAAGCPVRAVPGARVAALALAAATAVLAGCSSPPSQFYTLSPTGDAARTAPAANPAWLIELPPIDVPPQVAKAQFVVQTSDSQVKVLEERRWSSMPGDEIRRALSGDLTQQLGTIDVYGSPYPAGVPVYRISVRVQRFESWPDSHALIDAVWSVRSLATQAVVTCRSVIDEPVAPGYDALVDGHRRAVEVLSTAISSGVRAVAAAPQPAASAAGGKKSDHRPTPVSGIACPSAAAGNGAG
ncbi:PqiC family protein [Paraburkholderia acidipaludis]|uniref:PqiC family protein n=1 Tax=Paraburkholderia acidipaludis TaxID=660537 RepID=UPI0004894FDF|nr:PqiC family protein [Paraburkholderia acidipaludis]